jgi:hypothetical protein
MIVILKRAYLSSWHLNSAIILSNNAANIESNHEGRNQFNVDHASYVVASIMSSIAFIESAINEIYEDIEDEHGGVYTKPIKEDTKEKMKAKWGKLERERILKKYQKALEFSDIQIFIEHDYPYKDTDLAIKLRNQLVHYKPETFGGGAEHNLESELESRFELNPLMSNPTNHFFPDKCLGYGCAKWVLRSCLSLADDYIISLNLNLSNLPTR